MKNNEGGEQAYQAELDDCIAEEETRYQRFLNKLLGREVEKDA